MREIKTHPTGIKYFEVESETGIPVMFALPGQPEVAEARDNGAYIQELGIDDPLPEANYSAPTDDFLILWKDRYILRNRRAEAWISLGPHVRVGIYRHPFIDSLGDDVMGWHLKLPWDEVILGPVDSVDLNEAMRRAQAELLNVPMEQFA